MTHAIILAGGLGSRFWPLSSRLEPKQFLNIFQEKSMLDETLETIYKLFPKENIYLATNKLYQEKLKPYLNRFKIPLKNVLFEPEMKNNLAPIGVLTKFINEIDPQAVIIVLPCDNFIKYPKCFLKILKAGIEGAKNGYIVTLGITPNRAETAYGYIRINPKLSATKHGGLDKNYGEKIQNQNIYTVQRFIEKPGLSVVKRLIKDKRYFWNNGIFIFRPNIMLGEIKRFMPSSYQNIVRIDDQKDANRLWHKFPRTSIDYAIMQKTKKCALLPADYGWRDLANWQAIEAMVKKDKAGNIFKGRCIDLDSKRTICWSASQRLVATLGLKDTIIVDTKDALLVCAKDKAQEVKRIVQILKRKNLKKQI